MKLTAAIVILVLTMFFAFTACGSQAEQTTEDRDTAVEQPTETPENSNGIVLADGWAMNDAVSPSEVEAIMGTPGFGSFSEAASSASSGRPVGSFNVSSIPYSKVRFEVNVNGGMDCYETAIGYLNDPSEVEGSMWDMATIGEVTAGERTSVRIVVLKDDMCSIIAWDPAVFPDLDKTDTSKDLAELLITNIYGL